MSRDRNKTVAVVLAAGVGRRLGEGRHDGPKVLLDFAGRSLLERRLTALAACGVEEVCVTVGYEAEAVRAAAQRAAPDLLLRFVENPRFREGSLVSLAVQAEALTSGRPVLVMDGDVLHDSRMVERLLTGTHDNILLFDPVLDPGDEPVKICLRGERIVDFRKVPADPGERHGESVGFFRFSPAMAARLAERCAARVAAGEGHLEYEEAIRDLILADPDAFAIVDVGDLPWTEIDFPEDVVRARDDVLPQLRD